MNEVDTPESSPESVEAGAPTRWGAFWRFPVTRIAMFGAVMLAFYAVLSVAIYQVDSLGYQTWARPMAAVLALVVMARVDGISLSRFGLNNGWAAVREVVFGFAAGALTMSLIVGIMAMRGWYHAAIAPLTPIVVASLWGSLGVFLGIAVFEEVVYRGYFFQTLERRWGADIAFAVTMVTFGLMHLTIDIPGAGITLRLIGALSIAVEAGILFTAAYLLTRRLWMPIGLHWAWNFFQGPFFGAPVTGGNFEPSMFIGKISGPAWATGGEFGPEASLPALVVGTGFGLIILWLALRRKHSREHARSEFGNESL